MRAASICIAIVGILLASGVPVAGAVATTMEASRPQAEPGFDVSTSGAARSATLSFGALDGVRVTVTVEGLLVTVPTWSASSGADLPPPHLPVESPVNGGGTRDCVATSTSLSFSVSLASCYRTLP